MVLAAVLSVGASEDIKNLFDKNVKICCRLFFINKKL